jgi:hypothetical protein
MTPEQFTYWLQGFMEISNPTTLDEKQTQIIKDHLALVFDKQTPDRTFIPPLAPMPTTPWPTTDPFIIPQGPICEVSPYTDNGENPMDRIYCSHMVPQHMFGIKEEEDTVGTDSLKVVNIRKNTYKKILDRK